MVRRPDFRQDVTVGSPADIRLSFNEAADVSDRVRPSYPAGLFDALFQMLPAEPQIVEVVPGTGQATRDLLARGASVHAIEIGPAMAAKLRPNLPSDRLRVTVGDFETVNIAPGTADAVAVFSATAYHWISREAQVDRPPHSSDAVALWRSSTYRDRATPAHQRRAANALTRRSARCWRGRPPLRRRRCTPIRLEPDLQRSGLPATDAVLLRHIGGVVTRVVGGALWDVWP